MRKRYEVKVSRALAMRLAEKAYALELDSLIEELSVISMTKGDVKNSWGYQSKRMLNWLKNDSNPPYKVFVKGNKKLPFYSFSMLPIVTCSCR